jgi:hypothetical protein
LTNGRATNTDLAAYEIMVMTLGAALAYVIALVFGFVGL